MGNKENGQPQDLVRLRQRLDEYRRDSQPGKALPGWAWAAAGRLARRHGVHRSSRVLGLEYNKLKRLSGAAAADRPRQARRPRRPLSSQFVDLSGALAVGGDCRLVLEGPGGQRLSVQMPAGAATEVVLGLCRAGFGARS